MGNGLLVLEADGKAWMSNVALSITCFSKFKRCEAPKMGHQCPCSIACCLFKLSAWQKVKLGQKCVVFEPQDRDPYPPIYLLCFRSNCWILTCFANWTAFKTLKGQLLFILITNGNLVRYLPYSNLSAILHFPEANPKLVWKEHQLPLWNMG